MNPQGNITMRLRDSLAFVIFLICDYVAILLAEKFSFGLHDLYGILTGATYRFGNAYVYFWVPLVFLLFLALNHTYSRMQPILEIVRQIFYAVLYASVACIVLLFFMQASLLASRLYLFLFFLSALVGVYASHYLVLKFLQKSTFFYKRVLLIGAGDTAKGAIHSLTHDLGYRYELVGFLDDNPKRRDLLTQYPLLGTLEEAAKVVQEQGIEVVVITAPGMVKEKLFSLVEDIQPLVRDVTIVPNLFGLPMGNVTVETLFSDRMFMLNLRNNLAYWRNRAGKRLFDLVLGLLLIVPILVVIFFLAVCIKVSSRGSIFYNGKRVGKNGELFTCYKFRSMYENADVILDKYLAQNPAAKAEWEAYAKLRGHDPRVTKVGHWMRKTSLDELPQIFNVLLGNMSFVGPRPYLAREKEAMGKEFDVITMTVPGITGFWQTSGRNDVTLAERVEMESWYVKNWSVWLDLAFLFKTFKIVIAREGAY